MLSCRLFNLLWMRILVKIEKLENIKKKSQIPTQETTSDRIPCVKINFTEITEKRNSETDVSL